MTRDRSQNLKTSSARPTSPPNWSEELRAGTLSQQRGAAEYLAKAPEKAGPFALELIEAAIGSDEVLSQWAVSALEDLGCPPVGLANELIELLVPNPCDAPTRDRAYWAATLLGRLEQRAMTAVSPLVEVIRGPGDLILKQRALVALSKIAPESPQVERLRDELITTGDQDLARMAQRILTAP